MAVKLSLVLTLDYVHMCGHVFYENTVAIKKKIVCSTMAKELTVPI